MLRRVAGLWQGTQRPLRLELERVDTPSPPTSFEVSDFAKSLDELGLMVLYQAAIWPDKTLDTRDKAGVTCLHGMASSGFRLCSPVT